MKKTSLLIMSAVVSAVLAMGAAPGFAALLAKSPVNTPGGYPSWFQDQTGLALQGCLNDPPILPLPFCFLPDGVEQPGFLADQPKVFPGNFPIEHFYFLASTAPITLTNGAVVTEMEFALEAAFNPEVIANPNQEMFHRLRMIMVPNTASGPGTYVVVHPWGTTVLPPALQSEPFGVGGARGRATVDANVGAATGNVVSANDNFAGVLGNDPAFTISNYITQDSTPPPPVGFLGDCLTESPVTGGVNGNIVQILFRPAGAPADGTGDVPLGQTDLFVVCGQKTGLEVSPATTNFGAWKLIPLTPSIPRTFTVTNLTGEDIPDRDLGAVPVQGLILTTDNPAFSIVNDDTCADGLTALVPPEITNTCTFDVIFTPTAEGLASNTIVIASAGNPNATVSVTGTGDGIAPIVTLGANQAAQFTNKNDATSTISGTVADNLGGAGVASVQVSFNQGAFQPAILSGNTWSFTPLVLNVNAVNTITVTATDLAQVGGNTSTPPVVATITHDDIEPVVTETAPADGLLINKPTLQALTATATDDISLASISVTVDGGIVTLPATLGELTDGAHTVSVVATDSAGNTNSVTNTITVALTNGDISGNGTIDIADALLALRVAVALVPQPAPNTVPFFHGDVAPLGSPNGTVDIADALLILRKVVGNVTF